MITDHKQILCETLQKLLDSWYDEARKLTINDPRHAALHILAKRTEDFLLSITGK